MWGSITGVVSGANFVEATLYRHPTQSAAYGVCAEAMKGAGDIKDWVGYEN